MCDTKVRKEWPCPVKSAAERSRAYRQRLKLKREIAKCFPNAEHLGKPKAKTATERMRDYRQRKKTKREIDRCAEEASGICLKPDIKTTEEQLRDYRQRLKLKRALKKLDEGGSMLQDPLDKVSKTAEEGKQELVCNFEKNCDEESISAEDSRLESSNIVQGNQEKGQPQTKECNVEKSCKGESTLKELLTRDKANFIKQNLDYARSVLKQNLKKGVEGSPTCGNNARTYNSSAEYFFHLMIEQ